MTTPRRPAVTGDRGLALTEFAIVMPLLVLIAMGIAEFGLAWKDSITIGSALRSTARVGSSQGTSRLADHEALQALEAATNDLPDDAIERIVIYNAGTNPEPTVACRNGSASSAAGRQCNVYTAADFDRPASDFSGTTVCNGGAPDRFWCPVARHDDQGGELDTLGVWIRVDHDYITGIFPGGGLTIEDTTVMRLEPGR